MCILNTYLCDGLSDCTDQSDEDMDLCGALAISTLKKILINYNHQIKCLQFHIYNAHHLCIEIFTDTFNYKTVTKFTEYKYQNTSSKPSNYVLCHFQRKEMFSSDKRCMFERAASGDPVHCHNTEHLKFCENHECPLGYKCPQSYCIAIHMICDGLKDCPESEDELYCNNIITVGLLRCRYDGIYVHPIDICDGIVHCIESYDDESVCDIYQCPRYCYCKGYTVMCIGSDENVIKLPNRLKALFIKFTSHTIINYNASYDHLQMLDLSDTTMFKNGIPEHFFSNMSELLVLNLQNASISSLSNQSFVHLNKLKKINITNNIITTIHDHSFWGLKKIWTLNLTHLLIKKLESKAFNGMVLLVELNISHNFISSLKQSTFDSLWNLDTIDIRSNPITVLESNELNLARAQYQDSFLYLYTSPQDRDAHTKIHVDDRAICCYVPPSVTCKIQDQVFTRSNCEMLITKRSYVVVYFSYFLLLIFYGSVVLCFQLNQEGYNGQLPLMLYLAIKDLILACMLISMLIGHFIYFQNYALHRIKIGRQFLCKLHGFLTVYVPVMMKSVAVLMCQIHYRIIVHSMIKRPYSIRRIVQLLSAITISEVILLTLWTYYSDTNSVFLCSPMSLHAAVHSEVVNIILIAFYLLYNCCCLIMITIRYVSIYNNVKKRESTLIGMGGSTAKRTTTSTLLIRFKTTLLTHYTHFLTQLIVALLPFLLRDYNDEVSVLLFYNFAAFNSTTYLFLYNKVHLARLPQLFMDKMQLIKESAS